jgi:signal transduction histidine kinase
MKHRRDTNRLLVRHLLLPTIFLTVALAGGLRVASQTGAFLFIPPPLVALVLSVLLLLLFARGKLVDVGAWLSGDHSPLTNVSHALTLLALFFASAQAFNSVLPESGLFRWMFAFFFLWTLWNNQFANFDARRLLRSLVALFGTAFVLKHMLLASLYATDGGWLKRLAGALLEGFTQGTIGAAESFAPATGYISFFTLALYVLGLVLLPSAPEVDGGAPEREAGSLVSQFRQLSDEERALLREEFLRTERGRLEDEIHSTRTD